VSSRAAATLSRAATRSRAAPVEEVTHSRPATAAAAAAAAEEEEEEEEGQHILSFLEFKLR